MRWRTVILPLFAVGALAVGVLAPAAGTATSAGAGDEAAQADDTVVLQVRVEVPPFWDPFLDDRVAEAFVDRLRASMKVLGYHGKVFFVGPDAMVDPKTPQVTISLVEWRINHLGDIAC